MNSSLSEAEIAVRCELLLAAVLTAGVSGAVAASLTDSAPDGWWAATPDELASDLLLVAPGLRPREVRVRVATPEVGEAWQVSVVAPDRVGLLARTAIVCAKNGLSIHEARITSWPGLALQRLVVAPRASGGARSNGEPDWISIGQELRAALADDEVPQSLSEQNWTCDFSVDSIEPQTDGTTLVKVSGTDGIGVLAGITQSLSAAGADIRSAQLGSSEGVIRDVFVVVASDPSLAQLQSQSKRAIASSPRPLRGTAQ